MRNNHYVEIISKVIILSVRFLPFVAHKNINEESAMSEFLIAIPANPGSWGERFAAPTLQGFHLRRFGNAFRRISCALKEANCNNCLLRTSCPYAYIFETAPPPGSAALRNYESIPRPFVLEPPLETKTEYRPGEKLAFNLVLIGRATNYLPYFIVAFRELGELGIGKMRRKYRLAEIQAIGLNNGESQLVYRAEDQLVRNTNLAIQIDQAELLRQKDEDKTLTRLGLDFDYNQD